ncbi:hypothetical protein OAI55_01725 [Nitrosopumilus sp.]|nr:hypothetical protein [Nitrosopumilus sp.]
MKQEVIQKKSDSKVPFFPRIIREFEDDDEPMYYGGKGMTVLFRMKNHSHDDSISSSFANLKEKLEEFENKGEQV